MLDRVLATTVTISESYFLHLWKGCNIYLCRLILYVEKFYTEEL